LSTKNLVVLSSNGEASGPAQALLKFLLQKRIPVQAISHPLSAENEGVHQISIFTDGIELETRKLKRPHRPPLTYFFDVVSPLVPSKSKIWISFSPLTTIQALLWKKLRRIGVVVHWSVDFVPRRFENHLLNWLYRVIDRLAFRYSDLRVDLSVAALEGREDLHKDKVALGKRAPGIVVPMGFWGAETPMAERKPENARLVFLGHLVERMGVRNLPLILKGVLEDFPNATLEIIGYGPLFDEVKGSFEELGLSHAVTFHGFVKEHTQLTKILSEARIALAPYQNTSDNFTRFADPGKLKDYMGAGLPIVMTPVPPNWRELESESVAVIVEDSVDSVVAGITQLLAEPKLWDQYHDSILEYRSQYTWESILEEFWKQVQKLN
jgi:glycosyltransferase involved in cell wall biosynthesis